MTAQVGGTISSAARNKASDEPARTVLRKRMRDVRKRLTERTRLSSARMLSTRVSRLKCFRRSNLIACYLPAGGEIDVRPLILTALQNNKRVALPVVDRNVPGLMRFAHWVPGMPETRNRYGIREPLRANKRFVATSELDMVIVPLLAFDDQGNRLGMGGGYYDRCFSFLSGRVVTRPTLVGVAYETQKVDRLKTEAWDIPLSWVVTNAATYRCQSRLQK